jgi:hypothetical protein
LFVRPEGFLPAGLLTLDRTSDSTRSYLLANQAGGDWVLQTSPTSIGAEHPARPEEQRRSLDREW